MPKSCSVAYIRSQQCAVRHRDAEGRVRMACPACGAYATDGRGNEEGAKSLADLQYNDVLRLCLLECKCGTRYYQYA